mgnify:CR=1 FL=1
MHREHGRPPRLEVLGRSDDLIVTGGQNVWPAPVEAAIGHDPSVAEVAVFGRPDPEWGESVVAFVVPVAGASAPTEEELDRTCLERIARFKRPKEYYLVDALPTNNYGKVLKRELRQRLVDGSAPG